MSRRQLTRLLTHVHEVVDMFIHACPRGSRHVYSRMSTRQLTCLLTHVQEAVDMFTHACPRDSCPHLSMPSAALGPGTLG